MKEEWKDIEGYEGYQISNIGRIKSFRNKKPLIMSLCENADGYLMTRIMKNGKGNTVRAGRLVALHFVDGFKEGLEVNHIDSNRKNDVYTNLEWVTHKDNIRHSHKHGFKSNFGDKNPRSTISNNDAMTIIEALTHLRPMQIVRLFGYKKSIVMQIYLRRNWQHLSVGYEFEKRKVPQVHAKRDLS
jgi:hypothetical protein